VSTPRSEVETHPPDELGVEKTVKGDEDPRLTTVDTAVSIAIEESEIVKIGKKKTPN
jgi:hypothetical protein